MMRARSLPLLTLLCAAVACAPPAQLDVDSAWVQLTPGHTMAGYMRIANGLDEPVQLDSARAVGFGAVMIHETRIENGQARMIHAAPLSIGAHETVEFRPGGLHLMLMDPQEQLAEGDTVRITLQFANRDALAVAATVRRSPP